MLCIENNNTDAFFNLAAEEYLLKNVSEDIFMLWQNEPSVIIGKHQDVRAEVDISYIKQENIKIVRRFSGGGAVYHDLGNLNFTFIENGNKIHENKYTHQLIGFLETIGVSAVADNRQALTVGGLKISGSAQCIYKNRMMHHATLLFDTGLERLNLSLQGSPLEEETANVYVKSVKSPVTNLRTLVPYNLDTFKQLAKTYFTNHLGCLPYKLSNDDVLAISRLSLQKYSTPGWNYRTGTIFPSNAI